MRSLGRLLRLSLGATALADALAGVLLGAGGWPGGSGPWLQMLGALCVYHGGMALNDWADRGADARTRPERPIPSGAVAPRTAALLGMGLLVLGPLLAAAGSAAGGLVLALVALAALVYDLGLRGPWLGPLLLGLCRAGNLAAGAFAGMELRGRWTVTVSGWTVPLAYGAYVFVVSRLGRLEDGEDALAERRAGPRTLVYLAALLLLAPALLPAPAGEVDSLGRAAALALGLVGALGLVRALQRAPAPGDWTPADVVPLMGCALRRLLVFTAATALLVGGPAGVLGAGAILAGYPLSHALRRAFPPS